MVGDVYEIGVFEMSQFPHCGVVTFTAVVFY